MNIFFYSDLYISDTILIRKGEIALPLGSLFYLVGPNGCGKSTIFKMMLGLNESYFTVDSNDWNWKSEWDNYGYVEQSYDQTIIPWLSVRSNVMYYSDYTSKARELLLSDIKNDLIRAHTLSGGLKQRLSIVKEMGITNGLLLLDEPFSHQSKEWNTYLKKAIDEFCSNSGTIGIITHESPLKTRTNRIIYEFEENSQSDNGRKIFEIIKAE